MNVLTIDVGNSTISIGLFQNHHLTHRWSFSTVKEADTGLYFDKKVSDFFVESSISFGLVDEIMMSSVVPEINNEIRIACAQLFDAPFFLLQPEMYRHLNMDFVNPMELGTDIVANLVQAHKSYKKTCLVIDFGTALTFSVVNMHGKVEGVAIVPGIMTAVQSLFASTSQLPQVSLNSKKVILGLDTVSAIQAGVMNGYTGLIHHMVTLIKSNFPGVVHVIATGGMSGILEEVAPHFNIIDRDFTLKGLYTIRTILRQSESQ